MTKAMANESMIKQAQRYMCGWNVRTTEDLDRLQRLLVEAWLQVLYSQHNQLK